MKKILTSRLPFVLIFWLVIVFGIYWLDEWLDPSKNYLKGRTAALLMLVYGIITLSHLFIQMFFAHLDYRREEKFFKEAQEQVDDWHAKGESLERSYLFEPTFSVIIPAYNEDPYILRQCITSALEQKTTRELEVIVIDDGSPNRQTLIREAYTPMEGSPNLTILFQENQGKRVAQKNGFDHARGEVIVTVDSDTIFTDENSLMILVQPFVDEKVGAITGDVRVINNKESWLSRLISYRYWSAFNQERAAQSYFGVVMCCSGPLAAYRREIIESVKEKYIHQIFLAQCCTYGDDRHLTNLTLNAGWNVKYNPFATCRTEVPSKLSEYTVQQTRWNRSFYRELLWTLPFVFKKKAYLLYDLLVQVFLPLWLLAAVFAMIFEAWYLGDFRRILFYFVVIAVISFIRSTYGLLRERDLGFLSFIAYGFIHIFIMVPIRIYALFTLRAKAWGTRQSHEGS